MDELAKRLDAFLYDYDPYEYNNVEMSVDTCKKDLAEHPLDIISYLLDALENERGLKYGTELALG